MTFISIDQRRLMLTAGLAALFGIAALSGPGGPAASAGRNAAKAADVQVTLAAGNELTRELAASAVTRSMPARELIAPTQTAVIAPQPEKKVEAPKADTPAKPALPAPVAGLDQTQMNNAKKIVDTAKGMGLGKRAQVIAIATAMQESRLYNLASTVYAESYDYTDEGEGSDHDSVGLFQQRPQSGWGTVQNLMKPEYATQQFLKALMRVDGWEQMPLTVAAQTVQVSAFPGHYAKHEAPATTVVDALN